MSWIFPEAQKSFPLPKGRVRVIVNGDSTPIRAVDAVNRKYRESPRRRAWLQAHKEELREYDRQYSKKNRDRINERARERYRVNWIRRRAYLNMKQREYRAQKTDERGLRPLKVSGQL